LRAKKGPAEALFCDAFIDGGICVFTLLRVSELVWINTGSVAPSVLWYNVRHRIVDSTGVYCSLILLYMNPMSVRVKDVQQSL